MSKLPMITLWFGIFFNFLLSTGWPQVPPVNKIATCQQALTNAFEEGSDFQRQSIAAVIQMLMKGSSANQFNQQVLAALQHNIDNFQEWQELENWFLFLLTSQNFCSPAVCRDDNIFHGGMIDLPGRVKYLRSEINTPNFGDPYEPNAVLIRSAAAREFPALAAHYLVIAESKKVIAFDLLQNQLVRILSNDEEYRQSLLLVRTTSPSEITTFIEQFRHLVSSLTHYEGGIYLQAANVLSSAEKALLQNLILEHKSNLQLLIEEPYDPWLSLPHLMKKITLLHNNLDPFRYQLLQDSASMGFRPDLHDVVNYYYRSGKLSAIVNTRFSTENSLIPISPEDGEALKALQTTIHNLQLQLTLLHPRSSISQNILTMVAREAQEIQNELAQNRNFHENYYRLRTILAYVSKLSADSMDNEITPLETSIGKLENSLFLATNSGMTATRAVITLLADRNRPVYSSSHYWETDFLVENVFGKNPHYPEVNARPAFKLTLPKELSFPAMEATVDQIVRENSLSPQGQMVIFDNSISPFFYTQNFDLPRLTKMLAAQSANLQHPIYLIVDNTLDFAWVNATTLFPDGIPANIVLIFTTSVAKLHQLGFDLVPGGVISIHSHSQDAELAKKLFTDLQQKINAEQSGQSAYGLHLLANTFFHHYQHGSMESYLNYVVKRRQRNTRHFMEQVTQKLQHFLGPTGSVDLLIRDNLDPTILHQVTLSLHFDPQSAFHVYLKLLEDPASNKSYVAGRTFEALKQAVFQSAAAIKLNLVDGTSWGFHTTRLDWYFHTMRIAIGLEDLQSIEQLGKIFGEALLPLLTRPLDYLTGPVQIRSLTPAELLPHREEILALDRKIPHLPWQETSFDYYLQDLPGKEEYSLFLFSEKKVVGMLVAHLQPERDGATVLSLDKMSIDESFRGQGYFQKMFQHVEKQAQANSVHRIILQTSASKKNGPIIRTYENAGLVVSGLNIEMLPNGWPLIKVEMTMNLASGVNQVAKKPFIPLADAVYQTIKDTGNWDILQRQTGIDPRIINNISQE